MDFTIEELSMNAWPALKTLFYDGWIIRLSNGYSNRANSVNPIYPPARINLEEKISRCDEIFAEHNLPACYKLEDCAEHEALEKKLAALNYKIINETSLQTREISASFKNNYTGIIVNDNFSDEWKNSVIEFNKIGAEHRNAFGKIIGNISGKKIVVRKEVDNKTAGCGYGAIERGHVGVFDIVVKEEFRGRGYGTEIINTILSEAYKRGTRKSYLQVLINNSGAASLYKKLGFTELYRYWYRKKSV